MRSIAVSPWVRAPLAGRPLAFLTRVFYILERFSSPFQRCNPLGVKPFQKSTKRLDFPPGGRQPSTMDPVAAKVLARCEPLSPDIACGDCSSRLQAAFVISLTDALRPGMPGRRERPSLPAFQRWMRTAAKVKRVGRIECRVGCGAGEAPGYDSRLASNTQERRIRVMEGAAQSLCHLLHDAMSRMLMNDHARTPERAPGGPSLGV